MTQHLHFCSYSRKNVTLIILHIAEEELQNQGLNRIEANNPLCVWICYYYVIMLTSKHDAFVVFIIS